MDDSFGMLAGAAQGRAAAPRAIVECVARHLEVEPARIDPATVPDRAAVVLLEWARSSRSEFRRSVHAKLMPSQAELQEDQERIARTRRPDATLDECLRAFSRQRSQCGDAS